MNRTNRTLLVFTLSVIVAGAASFFVYRTVQQIPVREIEVRSYYVAVAAKSLPVGTLLTANDVKLVAWEWTRDSRCSTRWRTSIGWTRPI